VGEHKTPWERKARHEVNALILIFLLVIFKKRGRVGARVFSFFKDFLLECILAPLFHFIFQ
jgi:hypothetical protein